MTTHPTPETQLDVCVSCGDGIDSSARGLCHTCWQEAEENGTLEFWRQQAREAEAELQRMSRGRRAP